MSGDVTTKIDEASIRKWLDTVPKVFNTEFNGGFRRLGGAFYRRFARERLRKGGIQIRRQGASRRGGGRRRVSIPKKARLAGFRGFVARQGQLPDKSLLMGTRNPVMIAHEFGATITPKTSRYLAVQVRRPSDRRKVSQVRRGRRRTRRRLPFPVFVRRVVLRPRLGFVDTWVTFQSEATERLEKIIERSVQRAQRRGRRRA